MTVITKDRKVPKNVYKFKERDVEVPVNKIVNKYVEVPQFKQVESIVEVPQVRVVDKYVEVPQYKTVEKTITVPETHVIEKFIEVPQIEQRITHIPKIEYREAIREVPKLEYKEVLKEKEVIVPVVKDRHVEVLQTREKKYTVQGPLNVIDVYEDGTPAPSGGVSTHTVKPPLITFIPANHSSSIVNEPNAKIFVPGYGNVCAVTASRGGFQAPGTGVTKPLPPNGYNTIVENVKAARVKRQAEKDRINNFRSNERIQHPMISPTKVESNFIASPSTHRTPGTNEVIHDKRINQYATSAKQYVSSSRRRV